jgi:radical SAM superfamily enzyme YgiQ (UPF0313 family)
VEGYYTDTQEEDGSITFGLTWDQITNCIREYQPDFVGVSCLLSRQAHNAHRICAIAKQVNPSIQTMMGGCHPSALPQLVISDPNVDHIITGEAEESIMDVVSGRESGVIIGKPVITEDMIWPDRESLNMAAYLKINMPTSIFSPHDRVTQIEFTRSCPFNCCFCATTTFRQKYRKRSVNDCLAEVQYLMDHWGIQELDILDSNLVVDKKWAKQLFRGLQRLGVAWANPGGIWIGGLDDELLTIMKDSGCYQLSLAVESSTPRILKDVIDKPTKIEQVAPVVKTCKRLGIDTHAFFVCGFPEQTREEIENDYRFACKMDFTSASFNIICPLPGSRLYQQYADTVTFDQIELRKASIPHPDISHDEMEKMIDGFNRRFNRSLIWRNPVRFVRKYLCTLARKPSFSILFKLFSRQ